MTFNNASVCSVFTVNVPQHGNVSIMCGSRRGRAPRSAPHHVKPIATTRLVDFIERRSHQVNITNSGLLNFFLFLWSNRKKNLKHQIHCSIHSGTPYCGSCTAQLEFEFRRRPPPITVLEVAFRR